MAGGMVATFYSKLINGLLFSKPQSSKKDSVKLNIFARPWSFLSSNPTLSSRISMQSFSSCNFSRIGQEIICNDTGGDLIFPRFVEELPHIVAGFTTKLFGNMSMNQDGAPYCENFRNLESRVNAEGFSWALPEMVHGSNVIVPNSGGRVGMCDGLVTKTEELFICVTAADCGTVLLADPNGGVLGVCHCGWRGTVSGIVATTVRTMRREGARPQAIRAFVGPCIGLESFEVGEDVAEQFEPRFVMRRTGWARPHVDLKAAIESQLNEQGIGDVEVHPACTVADSNYLFSHRGSQGARDRQLAFIGVRSGRA